MLKDGKYTHLLALAFANVLAWVSFFSVVFYTNPKNAGMLGVVILGASLIIGLVCVAFLIWQLKILKKN